MPEPFEWTDKAESRLRKMWAEGQSAGFIAGKLGTTRNAVIGKVTRLKLAKRKTPNAKQPYQRGSKFDTSGQHQPSRSKTPHQRAMNRKADLDNAEPVVLEVEDDLPDVTHMCGLLALDDTKCRWPMRGEGAAMEFCGATKGKHDGPYCKKHTRASIHPDRRR